jgi:hypothetical protein
MSRTCAYALALPVGATTHECLSHCVEALGRQEPLNTSGPWAYPCDTDEPDGRLTECDFSLCAARCQYVGRWPGAAEVWRCNKLAATGRRDVALTQQAATRMTRSGYATFRHDRARLDPKSLCRPEQTITCRCGREQRAVLRQQFALDKPNRLALARSTDGPHRKK